MDFAVEISLPGSPCLGWSPGLSDKVEFRDFNLTEREAPMTDDRLPLAELAAKSGDPDFLRVIAERPMSRAWLALAATSAAKPAKRGATATASARSTPGSAR